MKLCRHEVRAASGERGAEVRFLSFPLQCNRGGGPAFGRLSARILGFALWACQCPHSGLRAVGVPVPAFWASRCRVPVPAFWACSLVWRAFCACLASPCCGCRSVGPHSGRQAPLASGGDYPLIISSTRSSFQSVILILSPVRDPHPLSST